ncbi:amino acid adenylation domain-containing protein [Sphaerimonospora cavernae]|uniref:Amino acid adenylation domain-containing protein n=1 Tax=Sphaerimonospora cavernae TaxID=1740611 RepID=A0ABV6TZ09_9ACTN
MTAQPDAGTSAPPWATRPGVWPLGQTQRGLWFLDNFNPDSSFYIVSMGLRLRGHLDADALRSAFAACLARHEALRTRFVTLDGIPYQVFVADGSMEVPLLDIGDLDAAQAEEFVQQRCDLAANTPFDLAADQLIRAELVRLADDHHVLVVAVHHIIFDGWSAQVLLSDLASAYEAEATGREPFPAPLELSVGGHAEEQEARFAPGTVERVAEVEHWRQVLDGASRLELPTELVRPELRTFAGATSMRDLDHATTDGVRALASGLGVTPFTVLAAAFALVLKELSGQDDVLFGVPLAGRVSEESTALIGFLVNVLPLRADLGGVRTFADAVERFRRPVLDLLTHQEFPFGVLVDELQPSRAGNRNPFFDVCFQYLPSPEHGLRFAGLDIEVFGGRRPSAQFDLSCDVHDHGRTLTVALEYSTEIFTERTVELCHEMFAAVLRSAVADPAMPVRIAAARSAALVSAERLDGQWRSGGLRSLVGRWARENPDAPAVSAGDQTMTYGRLDATVTRFAARLTAAGVRPGDRVGLLAEPSVEISVAILAVLQCGAAYVAIDVRTPALRAGSMLEQSGCRILVVHAPTRELGAGLGVTLLDMDADESDDPAWTAPRAAETVTRGSPAYVIFTSGSTGRPKAVLVHQSAVLTLAAAVAAVYHLVPGDQVLQMASPAVDVSVEELFGAWYAGACVVVHATLDEDLDELIRRRGLTVLNLPASRWHEWTSELTARGVDVPDCVRLVVAGSERLEPARVRTWRSGAGRGATLFNAYGTTEATVSSVWYNTACMDRDAVQTRNVPIGGPLPHVRLYVLDGAGEPVADGVPGELYIAGPGVALGYLGDAAATADRFLPDPFEGAEPGSRMYRTGDKVRRLASGALDFLGRSDTQVKVRGSRIDLSEVERTAAEVAGVAEFVADVREDVNGAARLIGYLRVAGGTDDGLAQARVAEWREVHDEEGLNEIGSGGADFNTSGWISSYTQEAIPDEHMREWLDASVGRILEHPAERVLEIGCGTGMVLFRVAPHTARYVGTDIAAGALGYVGGHLAGAGLDDGRVRLAEAAADDFGVLGDERFDLVIINSVAQYFPSLDYLERVIEGAWRRLRPGGRIFLGDVRDVTTLAAFHLSVRLAQTGGAAPDDGLADEVARLVEAENELCVAPGWFARFAATLSGATVVTHAKRGRADTEMNRFRFDVSLWRDLPAAPTAPARSVRFDDMDASDAVESYASLIDDLCGESVVLTGVPDARCRPEVLLADRLRDAGRGDTSPDPGVYPDDLVEIAAVRGYAAVVCPRGAGLLTVLVHPAGSRPDLTLIDSSEPVPLAANQPLRTARGRQVITAVREHMTRLLPSAMVPTKFVVVDEMPLTVSGKIDRPRLPDPARSLGTAGRVPGGTETERALCGIWARALGLAEVGIRDNFFEIGGDSITWLQIMSRCARAGYQLGARDIFEHQTVERLARLLAERARAAPTPAAAEGAGRPENAELSPIQRWFFDTFTTERNHQNQCQWYELPEAIATENFAQAVRAVAEHHAGLLSRFTVDAGRPRWHRGPATAPAALPLREVDLTAVPTAERVTVLRRESDTAQRSIHITDGPMFALLLFRTPAGEPDLVFWCVHHLVVDAVSWQFLSEDLDTALGAMASGGPVDLPPSSSDPLTWPGWSAQETARLSDDELSYWRSTASAPAFALPMRHPDASPLARDGHVLTRTVRCTTNARGGEAMLAACLVATRPVLAAATGIPAGTVWLEFHGRPLHTSAPDVVRTVGWFTALFPFLLTVEPGGAGHRARLSAVPHGGVGYGRARYLREERLDTAANVVVNYLGPAASGDGQRLRTIATLASATGPVGSPDAILPFAAEINLGFDGEGELTLSMHLGARYFDGTEARAFADALAESLATGLGEPREQGAEDGFELLPDATQASELAIELRERDDIVAGFALTPVQRTMLYRHLMSPEGDVNYNDFVLTLAGDLDVGLLKSAWHALGRRHEALRTSFEWIRSPEPVQLVHRSASEMRVLDWTGIADGDVDQRMEEVLRRERASRPALDGAPPFRLTLVRLAPNRHRLVWVDHHILLDGWSSGILIKELTSAYAELAAGREPFAALASPVRYRDYLRWLRQRTGDAAVAYWREAMDGFEGPTPLPFDSPPSASLATQNDFHRVDGVLPPQLMAGLRELAERSHTTLGSVLSTGWAAFLYRYSGRPLVTFGVAQSGRPAALGDVDAMVGMYMATLPMAVKVEAEQSVVELVGRVSEQGWKLMSLSGVGSLWDIYEWTGIPVSRSLFHSAMIVQNFGSAPPEENALPVRGELTRTRTETGFPLTLVVEPEDGVLQLVCDRRCFSPETARRLFATLMDLLGHIAAEPSARVGDLPVVTIRSDTMKTVRGQGTVDPPRNATEARVARAWCSVLGVEEIDRELNLFDAGATSLSAARLHVRLCAEFDVSLPITDVFRFPSVAAMAARLDGRSGVTDGIRTPEWLARAERRRESLRSQTGRRDTRRSRSHMEGSDQ